MCLYNCQRIEPKEPIYVYKVLRVIHTVDPLQQPVGATSLLYYEAPSKRLVSLFYDFEWVTGETVSAALPEGERSHNHNDFEPRLGPGFFHSFENKESALLLLALYFHSHEFNGEYAVCKFEIPKDSLVYSGSFFGMHEGRNLKLKSYASDKLKLIGVELFDYKNVFNRYHEEGVYWE